MILTEAGLHFRRDGGGLQLRQERKKAARRSSQQAKVHLPQLRLNIWGVQPGGPYPDSCQRPKRDHSERTNMC